MTQRKTRTWRRSSWSSELGFGFPSSGGLGNFEERRIFETHSRVSQEEVNNKIIKEIKKKREIN